MILTGANLNFQGSKFKEEREEDFNHELRRMNRKERRELKKWNEALVFMIFEPFAVKILQSR
jgi:hypothetical protein